MTKFIGGIADGKVLSLGRAPRFLRVTRDEKTGKIDALDQRDDEPFDEEAIFVYQCKSTCGGAFVDGRNPKTGKRVGGYQVIATYEIYAEQPVDKVARDNGAWQQWCEEQVRN